MSRFIWLAIIVIVSGLCFAKSFSYASIDSSEAALEFTVYTPATTSTITWYTSIPQRHADRIVNAFTAKTGIGVEVVRASTFTVRDHLLLDIENNIHEADVVTIADVGTYVELKEDGYLMEYVSPHLESFGDQYVDHGYWMTFAGFGICMAYDENYVDDPPQNWVDLLDPKWKGRIGLEDISTAGSQYGQYYMLRKLLGVEFWETLLSTQEPKIYYRTEDLANALLEGEIDIAAEFSIHTVYSYSVIKGTSIKGVYPEEGIPFILNPVAIMEWTEHPENAKIFFDFILSQEGQELMQRLNYKYSVREGMEYFESMPSFDSLNILLPDSFIDYGEKRSIYIQEFNEFLGESN